MPRKPKVPRKPASPTLPVFSPTTVGAVTLDVAHTGVNLESFFIAPADMFTFPLFDRPGKVWSAVDSDKVIERFYVDGAMHFHPKGSQVYCHWSHMAFGAWIVDDALTAQVVQECNIMHSELESVTNQTGHLQHMLNHVAKTYARQGHNDGPLLVEASVVMAYQALAEGLTNKPWSAVSGKVSKHRFSAVFDYIEAHLDQTIRLQQLASVANMSLYHFSRTFKQQVGVTPHQYLVRQRLAKAKRLIANSRLPLAQIALECGFASQSHLAQMIKRVYGAAPSALRR